MASQFNINLESMLKTGTVLHGTYRIDGYLSSGGFGNTYVATHTFLGTKCAIKEFFMKGVTQRTGNTSMVSVSNSENVDEFTHQLEKFKKEAQRLCTLDNINIVKVHDLFEENGTAYYVMDYIEGEDLCCWLEHNRRPMTEREVMTILPQVLNALADVHSKNIWHLDLKPANIMIDRNWTVKLIDFGASKQLDSQSGGATSSAIAYTNGYAPFEQMEMNYQKFGPWTDFYALGATLYHMLTGNKPSMPSDISLDYSMNKQLTLPMPDTISTKLRDLVLWLMKTNRKERPNSVHAISAFLNDNSARAMSNNDEMTIAIKTNNKNANPTVNPPVPPKQSININTIIAVAVVVFLLGCGAITMLNKEKPTNDLGVRPSTTEVSGDDRFTSSTPKEEEQHFSAASKVVRNEVPNGIYHLNGSITHKQDNYYIDMEVDVNGNKATGQYIVYNGENIYVTLDGHIDAEGNMKLTEYKNGEATGYYFMGKFNQTTYSGKYRCTTRKLNMNFSASTY